MKLVTICENTNRYVYHRTNSFHSVYNLLTSQKLNSLVSDFDNNIGTNRLSTALSLDDSKQLWEFGPYIVEILVTGGNNHSNEFVIYQDMPYKFTRWGIDLSPLNAPHHAIKWFNIDDIHNFNHQQFDNIVLKSFKNGATELGYCWIKDFMNGTWPELTNIPTDYNYQLDDYRKLPPDERHKWGIHFRRSLYGMDLDDDTDK